MERRRRWGLRSWRLRSSACVDLVFQWEIRLLASNQFDSDSCFVRACSVFRPFGACAIFWARGWGSSQWRLWVPVSGDYGSQSLAMRTEVHRQLPAELSGDCRAQFIYDSVRLGFTEGVCVGWCGCICCWRNDSAALSSMPAGDYFSVQHLLGLSEDA